MAINVLCSDLIQCESVEELHVSAYAEGQACYLYHINYDSQWEETLNFLLKKSYSFFFFLAHKNTCSLNAK